MQLLDKKQKIYLLDEKNFDFPTHTMMNNDLVAIGGDFHPQRLVNAYENGIFPWFIDEYNYIHWYSPQKRMVLYPEKIKVSKAFIVRKKLDQVDTLINKYNCGLFFIYNNFFDKIYSDVKKDDVSFDHFNKIYKK